MKYYKRLRKWKKRWRGKWRKIPNKLRATKSKNFFLTRKRKTSLSRSVFFFAFFFFSFSFHSSVTFCILFRQNLKLILKLRWSFVIFLCKKFSQGVRERGREEKGREGCYALMRISWLWHWHTHTEAVYYDYYLCGLNPQLLKRSLKFNIHLHFGQKTFQALMREREGRQREKGEREKGHRLLHFGQLQFAANFGCKRNLKAAAKNRRGRVAHHPTTSSFPTFSSSSAQWNKSIRFADTNQRESKLSKANRSL